MRPLITFIALAYNQERFIREAIDSAFAQTYSPLEIVICDDCSTDNTFQIISEMVKGYYGPHRIILHQNVKTLGIGGNINVAMDLGHGDLFVVAAGDDISLPMRTEVIYQTWEEYGRRATSLFSSTLLINEDGEPKGVAGMREVPTDKCRFIEVTGDLCNFFSWREPVVNGCSHAWSREIFDYFGPLQSDLEDLVLSFRTLAIGKMVYINEPLIKYRRHQENASFLAECNDTVSFEHRENRLRSVDEKSQAAFINIISDIETLHRQGRITSRHFVQLTAKGKAVCNFYSTERKMMSAGYFEKWTIFLSKILKGEFRVGFRSAARLLPKEIYKRLHLLRERLKSSRRNACIPT